MYAVELVGARVVVVQNAEDISNQRHDIFSICDDRGTDKRYYLYPILRRFSSKHGNVMLNIEQTDAAWSIDSLYKDTSDVAFLMVHETENLDPDLLSWKTIYSTCWCAYIHKNNHLYSRDHITLKDLDNEPIVMLSSVASRHYSICVDEMFAREGIEPKIISRVSNNASLSFAMHQGNGIILANELLAVPDHQETKLFHLPGTTDGLCIVWKKHSQNPCVSEFVQISEDFFKNDYVFSY